MAEEEGKEGKGSEMSCLVIRLATTCLNVQCANMSLKDTFLNDNVLPLNENIIEIMKKINDVLKWESDEENIYLCILI